MICDPSAVEETYTDVQDMLYSLAWKIKCCDQCTVEDRLSTANEAYAAAYWSYDPSKGAKFSSWVYNQVRYALMGRRVDCITHSHRCKQNDRLEFVVDESFWSRAKLSLSDDAFAVVEMLMDAPSDVQAIWEDSTDASGMVRNYLAGKGWAMGSLTEAFSEICHFLQFG